MADTGIQLLADRVLIDRAQRGTSSAFDELYRRHATAAWRLACAVVPRRELAAGAVTVAFASTLSGAKAVPATGRSVRAPLLAATRHAALDAADRHRAGPDDPAPADDVVLGDADLTALHALPELWRTTYWLVDVEGMAATEAGHVLGLPQDASALAARARLGLRQQVLRAARPEPTTAACLPALDRLAEYAAGVLPARAQRRVRTHLDACAECRDDLAGLDDLPVRLGRAIPALPVSVAEVAVRRWSASIVHESGPLRLILPNGRPVPAWAERVVAGAAAAAITVGITAAILAGGRSRSDDDERARDRTDEALRSGDGEVALGGDTVPLLDSDRVPRIAPREVPAAPTAPGAAVTAAPLPRSGAAPRTGDAATDPGTSGGTTPTAPAPPPDGSPPPPPPPPAPAPVAQVTLGVGDAVAVTAGDECVGLELLGTVIGCDPATSTTSDNPVTVGVDSGVLPPLGI